ncbi:SMP-30/gluconolactonase/LRE family protein [Geobacter sp. DSM 9736]|uniref:SMP-30/gluconolactonase/LRE family protein n=1 Tax=Geobacter sp. DSM 9736 TaxID=1277350 RepID=UPI000B60E6EC|nr:major royal jelly family protein [Geobacter sp. DSM 9736]SNB47879.1 Major royal jelly protein [Geobacter sp. DSM 9736]
MNLFPSAKCKSLNKEMICALLFLLPLFLLSCTTYQPRSGPVITPRTAALFEVAGFDDQVTGVAVSRKGRIFVNFPRWGKDPRYSVAELLPDRTLRPYPDANWNRWDGKANDAAGHFVCVQSVFVDREDNLWILDPASPSFKGVVPGGAKLLKVNLAHDRVERVYPFDSSAAPSAGYLNDVRIDPAGKFAYITESGTGAIVVLDLKTGESRRLLDGHPSTRAEPGVVPVIDGREWRDEKGKVPQVHADGIALDAKGEYLYYHALTGRTLYRIKTAFLNDPTLSPEELERRVERLAETGPVDGMEMWRDVLYFTALEENAVKNLRPDGSVATVVREPLVQWPDSLAVGPDNYLYVTASQIHRSPRFNKGVDRHEPPYRLFRVWLEPL